MNLDGAKRFLSRLGALADRFNEVFPLYFGLAIPVASVLLWPPPRVGNLVAVEGPLISYSLHKGYSRDADVVALIKLGGHPGRYWNDALKNGWIKRLDGRVGSTIRTMYAPNDRIVPTDGDAVKTYGLWIDGEEFRSPEDDVEGDQILAYGVLPVIGLSIASIGYFRMKRLRRQRAAAVPK